MKFKRGFTLIELLIVIAIIGILATVVMISVSSARAKAEDAKVSSTVASLMEYAALADSSGVLKEIPFCGLWPGIGDPWNDPVWSKMNLTDRAFAGGGAGGSTPVKRFDESLGLISDPTFPKVLTANPEHPRFKKDNTKVFYFESHPSYPPSSRYSIYGQLNNQSYKVGSGSKIVEAAAMPYPPIISPNSNSNGNK